MFEQSDYKLYQIKKRLDYLDYCQPINLQKEKTIFLGKVKTGKEYNPVFKYSKIKKLPEINIDLVEDDSVLGKIFNFEIQDIKDRKEFIKAIGSPEVTGWGIKIFGAINSDLLLEAEQNIKPGPDQLNNDFISLVEAQELVKERMRKANFKDWKIKFNEIGAGAMVLPFKKELVLDKKNKYCRDTLLAMLTHEIEGHMTQAANAQNNDFHIFKFGFGRYEVLSEGFALSKEEKINKNILAKISLRYLINSYALEHSLWETYEYARKWLDIEQAIDFSFRAKRGLGDTSRPGGLVKDKIYLEGLKLFNSYSDKEKDLVRQVKFDYRFLSDIMKLC